MNRLSMMRKKVSEREKGWSSFATKEHTEKKNHAKALSLAHSQTRSNILFFTT
jgi:hypothetical protein